MALDTPVDISRMVDFIDKNCRIPVSGENTQKADKKSKASEQKNLIPSKKAKEDSLAHMSSKELNLKFTDARKQEYLKEKEETSVIINRIASMNTSKKDVPGEVEDYVLNQFTEANGFTADVSCINSGLREQYNIIWVESTIDKINAKYWDTLKSSLITVSEDGKYQIKKEQLDIIRHE